MVSVTDYCDSERRMIALIIIQGIILGIASKLSLENLEYGDLIHKIGLVALVTLIMSGVSGHRCIYLYGILTQILVLVNIKRF